MKSARKKSDEWMYLRKSPDFTRPVVIKSPRFSMILVEPAKTKVLNAEVVPPWLQPIQLCLEDIPTSSMQVTDLWSHRMRKHLVREFFPGRVRSKVATVFHEFYSQKAKEKLKKPLYQKSASGRHSQASLKIETLTEGFRVFRGPRSLPPIDKRDLMKPIQRPR